MHERRIDQSAAYATPEGLELTDSTVHWQRFAVPYEFPVCFTEYVFDPANAALVDMVCRLEPEKRHRCLVFFDQGVQVAWPGLADAVDRYAQHHAKHIDLATTPIGVPGGEGIKTDPHFIGHAHHRICDGHIDRHSYVIAIGGGAVLDAIGFAAATAHRGVRHIRVPTTVLAQNDSGVGVKNAVNLFEQKNYIGTFAPPFGVLNDIDLVMRSPSRDKIAGMAEAVKVALIRDGGFFAWLEQHADALAAFDKDAMATMIRRCAELHMKQIAHGGDPFESGSARPLDYGHWAAHKLEGMTGHALRHGEAVAIGIALDAHYSVLAGHLGAGKDDQVCRLLEGLGFDLWHPALEATDSNGRATVTEGLRDFQEHLGGALTITLLRDIGAGIEVGHIREDLVGTAIGFLRTRRWA